MQLVERLVSFIAPEACWQCGIEGRLLCDCCREQAFVPPVSCCYRCQALSAHFLTCSDCLPATLLQQVWTVTQYEGLAAKAIGDVKFQRKRHAAEPLAQAMARALPALPYDTLVVPAPTATQRRRQRGYDQAEVLAKRIARLTGLSYKPLLRRAGHTRQLGASRAARHQQLSEAFWVPRPDSAQGRDILLVDDVLTTGATLEHAADSLARAGAQSIRAVVFARKQ